MAKRKSQKRVAKAPFKEPEILNLFDEEFRCSFNDSKPLEEINSAELRVLLNERNADIADTELIIEDQLEEVKRKIFYGQKYDLSFLRSARQSRQQLICECRLIEAELKRRRKETFNRMVAKLDESELIPKENVVA